MTSTDDWHAITLEIPFATNKHAMIAKQTIEVDAELQPHAVRRTLSVEENVLTAAFLTRTVRLARLTANGFLENIDLIVKTFEEFGDDAENKPIA